MMFRRIINKQKSEEGKQRKKEQLHMQGYAKLLLTKSSKRLYSSKERCITN
jgi:hypothetical protein